MTKYKEYLGLLCQFVAFVVWHHNEPVAADVMATVLGVIAIIFVVQIYFASIKSKQQTIAKYKARHGIPLDQPHKVDGVLREGFFKID